MATATATKQSEISRIRRELVDTGVTDPFSLLADCLARNEELMGQVERLQAIVRRYA